MNALPPDTPEPAAEVILPRAWRWPVALIAALALGWLIRDQWQSRQDETLLRTDGAALAENQPLLDYAVRRATPIYQQHCASCHGQDLKGSHGTGVPNLQDGVWLYGTGSITDIEQTILYGIRSGHPKSHNLTDMPGLGRVGQLSAAEVNDVVEYVLQLSQQPHDAEAAQRGKQVFMNQGVCYDCHSPDGYGNPDYGVPGLTGRGGSWLYGGNRTSLHKSTFDGRHGKCPAWINTLSFADIRALAAYLYQTSHRNTAPQTAPQIPSKSAGA